MDPARLSEDFRAITGEELCARFARGERQFTGVNLLRAEIERLAPTLAAWECEVPPPANFGYWRNDVSPLWLDRRRWGRTFHWFGDAFECVLEREWEQTEEWPEVPLCNLDGANLSGVNLRGSYLYRLSLRGADLRYAQLQAAILVEVDLTGAHLEHADLRELYAPSVRLADTNLYMARIERSRLHNADLTGANLRRVKARKASLRGATLTGADLRLAQLGSNDWSSADLRGTDFAGIKFGRAVIEGSHISEEQAPGFLDALGVIRDP